MNYYYGSNLFSTNIEIKNKIENHLFLTFFDKKDIKNFIKIYFKFDKIKISLNFVSNIKKIPKKLFDFTNLIDLKLNNNFIKTISPKICNLINLKHLELQSCKLEDLPVYLSKLVNLEELNVSNNLFKQFPKVILDMKNLKYLYISDNYYIFIIINYCQYQNLLVIY